MSSPGREASARASWLLNLGRVHKVLRLVGFFPGHRYVFWRALAAYARRARGAAAGLKAAELSIGNACQLSCAHCYATDVTERMVPLSRLSLIFDDLARLGCLSVLLVGGEPTLRRDLPEIVKRARARRLLPMLFTNGLLLDRERLLELRRAGLFGVLFSLLGMGARHDRFVGVPGAFESVVGAIREARSLGCFVAINVTATRDCIASGDFQDLIDLAQDLRVAFKFNYPALLGRWAGCWEQLLDERERGIVHAALERDHVTSDMISGFDAHACPAGRDALYIADSGEVTPCAYIPISFGNIGEEPLERIRERMRRSPFFGRRHGTCLVGEDRGFIERFVEPTFGHRRLPLRYRDHPAHDELA